MFFYLGMSKLKNIFKVNWLEEYVYKIICKEKYNEMRWGKIEG